MGGTLYVVATPIGNLDDVTFRAIRTLEQVHLIACEDTRTTRRLLDRFGVQKRMVAFFRHSRPSVLGRLIEALETGQDVAYVTEAGTPGISDPGAELVAAALAQGIKVLPVPGASALAAAISVSGLVAGPFVFEGFLPQRPSKRRKRLRALADESRPVVLYEGPHRVIDMLEDLVRLLGDREVVVARELTKVHEEVRRGRASEILAHYRAAGCLGEFTFIVAPAPTAGP